MSKRILRITEESRTEIVRKAPGYAGSAGHMVVRQASILDVITTTIMKLIGTLIPLEGIPNPSDFLSTLVSNAISSIKLMIKPRGSDTYIERPITEGESSLIASKILAKLMYTQPGPGAKPLPEKPSSPSAKTETVFEVPMPPAAYPDLPLARILTEPEVTVSEEKPGEMPIAGEVPTADPFDWN